MCMNMFMLEQQTALETERDAATRAAWLEAAPRQKGRGRGKVPQTARLIRARAALASREALLVFIAMTSVAADPPITRNSALTKKKAHAYSGDFLPGTVGFTLHVDHACTQFPRLPCLPTHHAQTHATCMHL